MLPMLLWGSGLFGKKFAGILLPLAFDPAWDFSSTCPFAILFKKGRKKISNMMILFLTCRTPRVEVKKRKRLGLILKV